MCRPSKSQTPSSVLLFPTPAFFAIPAPLIQYEQFLEVYDKEHSVEVGFCLIVKVNFRGLFINCNIIRCQIGFWETQSSGSNQKVVLSQDILGHIIVQLEVKKANHHSVLPQPI